MQVNANKSQMDSDDTLVVNVTFLELPASLNSMPNSNYTVGGCATIVMSEYFATLNGTTFLFQESQQFSSDIIAGF